MRRYPSLVGVDAAAPGRRPVFCCQMTDIRKASSYLAWWDPRQYVRDLRSGNVGVAEMARYFGFWLFMVFLRRVRGFRFWVALLHSSGAAVATRFPLVRGRAPTHRPPGSICSPVKSSR
jgi:hypothetical protein